MDLTNSKYTANQRFGKLIQPFPVPFQRSQPDQIQVAAPVFFDKTGRVPAVPVKLSPIVKTAKFSFAQLGLAASS
jgi:hypothetical protein